ncbi:hypothetical protein [Cronobacter phage GY3]|uniref:Uncharacterized protein n=1 Tax=Cronobacter phage GY3 TaxID=3075035 RepID=A0AA48R280_9CAUD|nr:hypothetical protein [Cronobacter phage GY3]
MTKAITSTKAVKPAAAATGRTVNKASKLASAFKVVMSATEIDAAIVKVCDTSKTLQDDIHEVAVAIMLHCYNHNDFTKARALVEGLGKGIRAKALVDWFHKAGLKVDEQKGFTGFNRAIMEKNWDFCKKNRWYTMKQENPFAGFDFEAEVKRLLARAEKAIAKDAETPEDARAEDYKMAVTAEQISALRKLSGATLQ